MRNKSQKHGFFTLAGQHNLVKENTDIRNIEIRIYLMSKHHEPYMVLRVISLKVLPSTHKWNSPHFKGFICKDQIRLDLQIGWQNYPPG